jgi:hypothetical protein
MYSHFRAIAFEDGPLYNRDVEKLDRQDDGAATRLGSADVLQWLIDHYPQLLGPIIYLFIFYELIDAYQNRHMKHAERAQLALRALFFMEMWEEFLEKAGYAKAKHFISHEACDITRFLIHGLLQLIIVYRDDLDGVYPLLPWLLSTEVCEHVFGLCHQIIKDFTLLDFFYMMPKLFIRLREHTLFSKFSDGKERASGYNHTYTDNRDIDLVALSTYPSDSELNDVAKTAYEEVENLWTLLGAPPSLTQSGPIKLPSIRTWFKSPDNDHGLPASTEAIAEEEFDSDYESCVGDPDSDGEEDNESAEVQRALDYLEKTITKSFREDDEINGLALAAVSLSVGDGLAMQVLSAMRTKFVLIWLIYRHGLPELDANEMEKMISDERARISASLNACLAPINAPDEPMNHFDVDLSYLSFDKLVRLRLAHQTRQAATGVRKKTTSGKEQPLAHASTSISDDPSGKKETERQLLMRRFNEVIKQQQERGAGTGAERGLRWTSTAPVAGNAANAAEAAATRHKMVRLVIAYVFLRLLTVTHAPHRHSRNTQMLSKNMPFRESFQMHASQTTTNCVSEMEDQGTASFYFRTRL